MKNSDCLRKILQPAQPLDFLSFHSKYENADNEFFFISPCFPKRPDELNHWKTVLVISVNMLPETCGILNGSLLAETLSSFA